MAKSLASDFNIGLNRSKATSSEVLFLSSRVLYLLCESGLRNWVSETFEIHRLSYKRLLVLLRDIIYWTKSCVSGAPLPPPPSLNFLTTCRVTVATPLVREQQGWEEDRGLPRWRPQGHNTRPTIHSKLFYVVRHVIVGVTTLSNLPMAPNWNVSIETLDYTSLRRSEKK